MRMKISTVNQHPSALLATLATRLMAGRPRRAIQSLAMLVSLLMEVGALIAPLEPSSPTMDPLLLSASSAQSERLLRAAQVNVPLAPLYKQQVDLDLLSALTSLALLVSSW